MNLQRVIDVVTERYGEVSSLYQLMEAFLFAGQFQQGPYSTGFKNCYKIAQKWPQTDS